MTEHTNKQFDADLENVRSQFLQMGGVVEAMIQEAIDALASGDMALVDKVREREKEVNRHEVEIDESISRILARHQPTAIDLRMLMAVSKMLTDMERSGDEAEKVATVARRIHEGELRHFPVIELRHMAANVRTMLHQALDAFARLDPIQAAAVVRSDKEVDKEWKGRAASPDHLHDRGSAHHLAFHRHDLHRPRARAHRRSCQEHVRARDLHGQGRGCAPHRREEHRAPGARRGDERNEAE